MSLKELRIYNYSKRVEDRYKGVKFVNIKVNGKSFGVGVYDPLLLKDKIYVRKAADIEEYNKPQRISLIHPTLVSELPKVPASFSPYLTVGKCYNCPMYPCGSILKFQLNSNWGHHEYIGLSSVSLFDMNGKPILISKEEVWMEKWNYL